jgi:hypothetical protein
MQTIRVTELEEGEIGEDESVAAVVSEMGYGSYEIRMAAGGRASLVATEDCCVVVDDELLKQINCTASVVTATLPNFTYAPARRRIATVKSAPFAVSRDQIDAILGIPAGTRAHPAGSSIPRVHGCRPVYRYRRRR